MLVPLLRTKLYIPPPQPGLVHRPRLTNLITEGLTRKLTLISAPAGFGKTTLVSEWILTSPRRVTWLSLDEADNDPTRFWTYFLEALQILQENLGEDAQAFLHAEGQPASPAQLESFLTVLLNDIAALSDETALVLDDYQQINNQAIYEGIIFLVDHLPPKMHIIITCRADPPLHLARLRARGQMNELRAEDLRFTSEEVGSFLNQIMKLNIPVDQIVALEARTEGWIAGLQLAAISMQRRENTAGFIESFTGSHRFVLDYLVDEVLSCQPEDVQSFLLETSILERFTGSLCNSVTGKNDGQGMLELLEQANLFIIPLDHERHWYRYHHLFADLLHSRLKEFRPEDVLILHHRACDWFEREGLLPEAINHALTVREFDRAAGLIEKAAEIQRQSGEIATLTGWINALPGDIRRSHLALCVAYARALVDTAQPKAVEALLEDVQVGLETNLRSDDPMGASLRGQSAALAAYLEITRNHFDQAIELSERARQLLDEDDTRWRSFVALNLAGAYRFTSNWAGAGQTYLEASALSQVSGDKVNTLVALSLRGEVLEAMGHLHQSVQQFEQVLQLAQTLEIPAAPVTGYALTGIARARYEWNDLEAAGQYAQNGIERGKKAEIMDILLRGYLVLAHIRQAQGDLNGALDVLKDVEPVVRRMGVAQVKEWVNAFRARVWLAQGETEAAVGWASTYQGKVQDTVFPSIAIVLARVRLAQGEPDSALQLLEHALQSAHAVGREGNAVQILVAKAMVHQAKGSHKDAFSTLSEALTLAQSEGYIRVFLDEGEPMQSLISDLRFQIENRMRGTVPGDQKTLLDYIHKLLVVFTVSSIPYTRKSMMNDLTSSIPEPLSARELEVLHLMAAGLSNRDIADMDVVSINTVKTQVKNIYGKLGVHHREDAIAVAHELHLL